MRRWRVGGGRAQRSGDSTHLGARLRLPGHPGPQSWGSLGPREGEELSAGVKRSRGVPKGSRGAYRHPGIAGVLAGAGWAGALPGVSLRREEVRAGGAWGGHWGGRGYGSTPTPTHLLAPGALLPLRGGKPEMCISRRPRAPPPRAPPLTAGQAPGRSGSAPRCPRSQARPLGPPHTYRLPAGPGHPREPPLPFGAL